MSILCVSAGLATGRRGQKEHLTMTTNMFRPALDENDTPVIWFDITMHGTKNWQGGLNATDPVSTTMVFPTGFLAVDKFLMLTCCFQCSHLLCPSTLMSTTQNSASTMFTTLTNSTEILTTSSQISGISSQKPSGEPNLFNTHKSKLSSA